LTVGAVVGRLFDGRAEAAATGFVGRALFEEDEDQDLRLFFSLSAAVVVGSSTANGCRRPPPASAAARSSRRTRTRTGRGFLTVESGGSTPGLVRFFVDSS